MGPLERLKDLKEVFLEALFPSNGHCIFCNALLIFENNPYCEDCGHHIYWIGKGACEKCGKQEVVSGTNLCNDCSNNAHYYDQGIALFTYDREGKKIIQEIKFEGNKKLAKWLGEKLGEKLKTMPWEPIDMILPIPLHSNRLDERGFNQSMEISKGILTDTKHFLYEDVLIRIKDTPHQTDLSKRDRQKNIQGAFRIQQEEVIKDKIILLIDDVYTTGATMNACAETLQKAGAKKIYFAVAAIGRW